MEEEVDKGHQLLHADMKVDRQLERLADVQTLADIIHQYRKPEKYPEKAITLGEYADKWMTGYIANPALKPGRILKMESPEDEESADDSEDIDCMTQEAMHFLSVVKNHSGRNANQMRTAG